MNIPASLSYSSIVSFTHAQYTDTNAILNQETKKQYAILSTVEKICNILINSEPYNNLKTHVIKNPNSRDLIADLQNLFTQFEISLTTVKKELEFSNELLPFFIKKTSIYTDVEIMKFKNLHREIANLGKSLMTAYDVMSLFTYPMKRLEYNAVLKNPQDLSLCIREITKELAEQKKLCLPL